MKLSTVMINSENPQGLVEFYTKIFGKPAWDGDPYKAWMIGEAGIMVGPHSEVKGQNKEPGRVMVTFETDDVKGEFERMKGQGATVIAEPAHPGGAPEGETEMLLATLADPDGNYIQLASPFDPTEMPDDK